MSTTQNERYINELEVSKLLGLKPRTLQQWRITGKGPRHIKMSERTIRYELSEVQKWLESLKK